MVTWKKKLLKLHNIRRRWSQRHTKTKRQCAVLSPAGHRGWHRATGHRVKIKDPTLQPPRPTKVKKPTCIFGGIRASIDYHQVPVSVLAMMRRVSFVVVYRVHSTSPRPPLRLSLHPAAAVNGTRPRRPCPETPSPTRRWGSGPARSP